MDTESLFWVYIIQSQARLERYYTGFTEDLDARLRDHNAGKLPNTARYAPWRMKTAIAFTDRDQALDFERYLKTSSGRAFAKKRL
jgi:predicted GIY-YIG superfamily endonuclease